MRKLKVLGVISLALIGGGTLVSIPLAMTSCGKEKDVPKEFYKYSEDGSVLGWSDKVINDPSILKSYNTMNLHGEIINGNCKFSLNNLDDSTDTNGVFEKWTVHKIDLSDTYWEIKRDVSDNTIHTGYRTFAFANLSHCSDLNLRGANFSWIRPLDYESALPADTTFANANLSNLKSLDLSKTNFSKMIEVGVTASANSFFRCANFSHLKDLNLSQIVVQPSDTTALVGSNYIEDNFFAEITKNSKWQSSKLKITDTGHYWETQDAQLNSWFDSGGYEIN